VTVARRAGIVPVGSPARDPFRACAIWGPESAYPGDIPSSNATKAEDSRCMTWRPRCGKAAEAYPGSRGPSTTARGVGGPVQTISISVPRNARRFMMRPSRPPPRRESPSPAAAGSSPPGSSGRPELRPLTARAPHRSMRSIKWGRCSARGQLVWKSRNRSLTSTLFLSRSAAAGLLAVSPTLYKALEAGNPVDAEAGGIAADSLAPRRVGALMFPIAKT
jgi:hypothetical protein